MHRKTRVGIPVLFLFLIFVPIGPTGCSSVIWDEVNLMPPPDVYGDGMLDPLPEQDPMDLIP